MSDIRYRLNGEEVTPDEFRASTPKSRLKELLAQGQTVVGQSPAGWPRESDALAVHPKQVGAAFEQARALGVPTEFTPSGKPVITSPGHQRALCKALGKVDLCERNNTSRVESD